MSRMIQVRNVPDWLHEELVRRAKRSRRTLTEYVQDVLKREVTRAPADEVFERLRGREPVDLGLPAAELVHEERAVPEAPESTLDEVAGATGYRGPRKSLEEMEAGIAEGVRRAAERAGRRR